MAANTYPDPRVSRFINLHTIPVQFNVKEDPGAWARYHCYWTPCIIYQDVDGAEYRRSVGPLNVDQLLAELALARGLRYVNSGRFDKGIETLEEAVRYTEAVPLRHAENLYWLAVARFESTGELQDLLSTWEELRSRYPNTEWDSKTRLLVFD